MTTRTDADRSALIPEAGMAASVDALVVRGAEPPGEPASAASAVQRIRDAIFVGTDPDPGWPTPDHPECVRRADLVLAALTNAGLVVVPREPTDAMMDAAMNSGQAPLCDGEIRTIWGVMIGDGRLLGHD